VASELGAVRPERNHDSGRRISVDDRDPALSPVSRLARHRRCTHSRDGHPVVRFPRSKAHYVIDCFGSEHLDDAGGPQEQGMERHSTELAYSFAMGHYFSRDAAQRDRFRARFNRLLAIATTIDANRPARCYNWAFQASSQLVYFMSRPRSRHAEV
jgi:hypothetical protein